MRTPGSAVQFFDDFFKLRPPNSLKAATQAAASIPDGDPRRVAARERALRWFEDMTIAYTEVEARNAERNATLGDDKQTREQWEVNTRDPHAVFDFFATVLKAKPCVREGDQLHPVQNGSIGRQDLVINSIASHAVLSATPADFAKLDGTFELPRTLTFRSDKMEHRIFATGYQAVPRICGRLSVIGKAEPTAGPPQTVGLTGAKWIVAPSDILADGRTTLPALPPDLFAVLELGASKQTVNVFEKLLFG